MTSDDASFKALRLSVRAERLLERSGKVETVGGLRALVQEEGWLGRVGLGAKHHREAIAKAFAEWDAKRAAERVATAKAAMLALTDAERARIHAEVGCCACAEAADLLARAPDVAVGAALGGVLAVILRRSGPRPR